MGFAIAGAALGGALISSNAAQSAASTEENAANNATAAQLQMFNTEQQNMQPYQQAGSSALSQLQQQLPGLESQFTMSDFQSNPGYQFQLQQGQQAVQNSAAARGLLDSSAAMKNMDSYTQGMANTDYQQALSNFTQNQQQRYNMLSGLANSGQNASANLGTQGTQIAGQIGNNIVGAANASAAGQVGTANAISGALGTGMNGFMQQQYLNAYQNNPNSAYNNMFGNQPGVTSPMPYSGSGMNLDSNLESA